MRLFLKYLLAIAVFTSEGCASSSRVKDGNTAYELKQYATAIGLLKKEVEEPQKPDQKAARYFLIGKCYEKLLDYSQAYDWYAMAEKNNYGPESTLRKAYVLKSMMKYEQAISAFESLRNVSIYAQEAKRQIEVCKSVRASISENSPFEFSLEKLWSDSYYADYASALYDDDFLVITSDREESTGGKRYGWTGNKFSDLYLVDKETRSVKRFDSVINSEANEGTAYFTADYQTVVFTRCVAGENDKHDYCKLYTSKRQDGIWSDPQVMSLCEPNINYGQPCLFARDSVLIFSAAIDGGTGGYDLWYAEWDGITWNAAAPLPMAVNSAYDEFFPTADGDTLYFSSARDDGMGGLDIYKSYVDANGKWSKAERLGLPYNSGADDFALLVDRKAPLSRNIISQGYFSSSRGNEGRDELYAYKILSDSKTKDQPITPSVTDSIVASFDIYLALKVVCPLYENNDPNATRKGKTAVPFAEVYIKEGGLRKQFRADKNGLVLTNLSPDVSYEIVVGKDSFLTSRAEFSTFNVRPEAGETSITINKEIELEKIYKGREIVLKNIYYDYDKWDITEDARPALNYLVQMLKANPSIQIELGSHTDCRGEPAYNDVLSQKRAQSAVDYLTAEGIDAGRLSAIGYGESRPAVLCECNQCTEAQHQANRRTTFKIL